MTYFMEDWKVFLSPPGCFELPLALACGGLATRGMLNLGDRATALLSRLQKLIKSCQVDFRITIDISEACVVS